ncbi:MAG: hypothetical protein HY726_21895 [Candidatus Rokubacteria bacterium]|nr:hypothetical protein [Candidatus Rokubacteria bacterium]
MRPYIVIFKPVTYRSDGKPKGNVDAELVLQAMIDFPRYEKAVIVTNDGDSHCFSALPGREKEAGARVEP